MYTIRSPPVTRSGKGKPAVSQTDKLKAQRSLSASSVSPTTTMPTDNVSDQLIEEKVNKLLAQDRFVDMIVAKLSAAMKTNIEEAVSAALVGANTKIAELTDRVTELEAQVQNMSAKMADRCDDLEQYQRRNNVRIFGIPESSNENTDRLAVQLFREKLGVELSVNSLCRSHRVGRQPQPTPDGKRRHRPIIVRFTSYRDRRLVFDSKKKLKGSGVTIREDLTAARQKVFERAVALHGLRNCWTNDGRILWVDKSGVKGVATHMADFTHPS